MTEQRHAILGRRLPVDYVQYVERRLVEIPKERAGGAEQFAREVNAVRARAREELEQGAGQNLLLDGLFRRLGFADAFQAPAPVYSQSYGRGEEISNLLNLAVLEHLGFGPIQDLAVRLNHGVTHALDYFFGDWWQGNEDDARALDKSRPDRALGWWEILAKGLLLCGLTGRWDDAVKICSWFDERVYGEYPAGQIGDDYRALFLCFASNLRAQPIPRVEEILARVKACRIKRAKLLCAAWEAAVARDQKAFDKAFKESVTYFLKKDAGDGPVEWWVALDQSVVWLIAERNGLKFPKLKEELDAAVVRRQTIGLAKEE